MGILSCTGAIVSFSPLPGPSGSGSVTWSPEYSRRSRASALRTTSMYSRVRPSCEPKRTPCQPSLTCGPEDPMPSSMRPSESWSSVAAVIAVIAGEREDRRAALDRARQPRDPAEDRRGVGAVGLGCPDGVVAESFGLLDDRV